MKSVDDRDAVVRALLLLPVKQRRVVVMRHLLDLSEAEVAASSTSLWARWSRRRLGA